MEIRLLKTPEERLAVTKLQSVCFLIETRPEDLKPVPQTGADVFGAPTYGCVTETGELAASVISNQYSMYFDGHEVSLAGIGGVCTAPEYRRGGLIRKIFERMLRDERDRGTLFSGLYPFSHLFYRKFGYELAWSECCYEFKTNDFSRYAHDLPVKMLLPEDDRAFLMPIYKAFASGFNLPLVRSEARLAARTKSNPYTANEYAFVIGGDKPVSYVCFNTGDGTLNVKDYAYAGPEGLRAMLGFLYRYGGQLSKTAIILPDGMQGAALVDESYDVKMKGSYCYMMRSLDHERVLTLMKKAAGAEFVIRVEDDFLPECAGTWRVTETGVTKTDEQPDLIADVRAFTQLALGYADIDTLAARGTVSVFGNEEALKRTFVSKRLFVEDSY